MNIHAQQTPEEMKRLIFDALHLRTLKAKLSAKRDKDGSLSYQESLNKIDAKEKESKVY